MEPSQRQSRGKAAGSWQWSRTGETQRALLDAARAVFTESGYSEASISDIVERAGYSVGSVYHHFGGKSELFIALWDEHQLAQRQAAVDGVARARQAGVADPAGLFCAGARAVLEGAWARRDLDQLFLAGDAPPGFEVLKRARIREWITQNDTLLGLSSSAFDLLYVQVLTSIVSECARQVGMVKTRRHASNLIDAAIAYMRRVMADGPWKPTVASTPQAG